jgi:hypothetical protein
MACPCQRILLPTCDRVLRPAWCAGLGHTGLAEKDFLDFEEPYRTGPPRSAAARVAAMIVETYLVGGAVRDALMGLPVQDRDWVVVGATPQHCWPRVFMPVGRDFPVFLHPR